ncbi:MAG: FAD-binding oxidoreductase [Sphingomonas sp.]|nr:FAD-binding oxidoreductase [Sphingomonas sp.]
MSIDRRKFMLLAGASCAAPLAGPVLAKSGRAPWGELARRLGARFQPVRSPLVACRDSGGKGADALFASLKNPYRISDDPALTQTLGWTDGWTSAPSRYVVAAESATDVAAAVDFARRHNVRLVTKGGGHSYFGNSNAANSLLLWTKKIDRIEQHDAFVPAGAPAGSEAHKAVSIGAGCLWGRIYRETAVKHGRYVQGGGCLTVGVGGFVLGGGFGSFSKGFGTGAANLLEAEIVTADGKIRIANMWQDPELFFAFRGGGGGTFGIVTRLTLRTFDLPATIGAVLFDVTASDDQAWRTLVEKVMTFYADSLFNPHWGEQIRFGSGRKMSVALTAYGLDKTQIEAAWKPFFGWLRAHKDTYSMGGEPMIVTLPARDFWNPEILKQMPGIILSDDRPRASPDNVFWAGNLSEAGQVLHAYKSRWLPQGLLKGEGRNRLVDAIIAGASEWTIALHMNKGLAGGDPAAVKRSLETATNPQMVDAFGLLIVAAEGPPAWPGIPGHIPDNALGRKEAAGVARAFAPFVKLVPDGGCYLSEADYFGRDWREAYWGGNYPRLLRAKRTYDPTGMFRGHHTVGT